MKFITKLKRRLDTLNSHLCVGLDSQYDRIPQDLRKNKETGRAIFDFNRRIVDATYNQVVAYKINLAFYDAYGIEGLRALYLTTSYVKINYPRIPLLADCKRSEIDNSASMIKKQIFNWLGFDCIMVTPWFGYDAVKAYLDNEEQGVLIYVHDSNPSACDLQDLKLKNGKFLYEVVAEKIVNKWNQNGNIIVEAGSTYPRQLKRVRQIVGEEMPILTAGIGSQGGSIKDLKGLFGKNRRRLFVNISRAVIFSGTDRVDYFETVAKTAKRFRQELLKIAKN